jgi:hypothetical protein
MLNWLAHSGGRAAGAGATAAAWLPPPARAVGRSQADGSRRAAKRADGAEL